MREPAHTIQLRKYGTDEFVTVAGKSAPKESEPLRDYKTVMAEREQATPQASLMRRVGRWLQDHAPGAAMAATPPAAPEPRDVIFLKNYETQEVQAFAVKPKHEPKAKLQDYNTVMANKVAIQEPSSMKKLGEWLETHAPDAPAATPGKPASKPLGHYRS